MKFRSCRCFFSSVLAFTLLGTVGWLQAQGSTAFTYQGRLADQGAPANGNYDLSFTLYNDGTFGSPVGGGLTDTNVAVSNGIFTVSLDFGPVFNGSPYWLLIGVRTNGSAGAFTYLSPRQPLTPAPYALFAASATTTTGPVTNISLWGNGSGPALTLNADPSAPSTLLQFTTAPGVQNFYLNASPAAFPNQSVPDYVVNLGFGQGAGGGPAVPGQQMDFDQWEPYYVSGPGGLPQVERWMGCSGTNGVQLRPFFYTCGANGFVTLMLAAEDMIFYSDSTRANVAWEQTHGAITTSQSFTVNNDAGINVNSTTNAPALLTLNSGAGVDNLVVTLGVAEHANDLITHSAKGDILLVTSGNEGGNLDLDLAGTYAYQFTPHLLNLLQGGLYSQGPGTFNATLSSASGFTNSTGSSFFGGDVMLTGNNILGDPNRGGSTTPALVTLAEYHNSGGPSLLFAGAGHGVSYGFGATTGAGDERFGFGAIRYGNTNSWQWPPYNGGNYPTFDIMGTNIIWTSQIVSNNLTVGGSIATPISARTASYQITAADSTVLVNGAGLTMTLPSAIGLTGTSFTIKLIAPGTSATVAASAGQQIDGGSAFTLAARYSSVTVQSDGSQWWIISTH